MDDQKLRWRITERITFESFGEEIEIFEGLEDEVIERCQALFLERYGVESNHVFGQVIHRAGHDEIEQKIKYMSLPPAGSTVTLMHVRYKD